MSFAMMRHARCTILCSGLALFAGREAFAQTADGDKAKAGDPPAGDVGGAAGQNGTARRPLLPAVNPSKDAQDLTDQGKNRPPTSEADKQPVFSEDWWTRSRPILEVHGYFRTRGEVLHNFTLGRRDPVGSATRLWPQPLDNSYTDSSPNAPDRPVALCGSSGLGRCIDKTQASANMRFRFSPELHISDNLRVMSQIDALDNLILGSTPDSYALGTAINPYAPITLFSTTQGPPTAGVNGVRNSIDVKRAYAEYATPIGQLRFGRMPQHWGLGMLYNSGDGIDHDYQTNIDRIMFTTGVKALDLYFGGSWDFPATGPTTSTVYDVYGGQTNNTANLVNAAQWSAFVFRKPNPELQRLTLAKGDVVLSGGLFASLKKQELDVQQTTTGATSTAAVLNNGLERRGATIFTPDIWVQLLWKKLRVEFEGAAMLGSISKLPNAGPNGVDIRQFGFALEGEFRAAEDKLRIGFGTGWASGDPWADSLQPNSTGVKPGNGGTAALSTFRFHPAYMIDSIFFRRILTRVEGAYYFRPSVEYDFSRNVNGQRFGGGASMIYSRASEFTQTPGHARDLGFEIDAQLYYQAKDGTLNDDPSKVGGFFAMLQGGIFFPMGGLDYLAADQTRLGAAGETSSAQLIRLFLGVVY